MIEFNVINVDALTLNNKCHVFVSLDDSTRCADTSIGNREEQWCAKHTHTHAHTHAVLRETVNSA